MIWRVIRMALGGYSFVFDVDDEHGAKVFHDGTRHRGKRVKRLTVAIMCIFLTWLMLFLGGTISLSGLWNEVTLRWQLNRLTGSVAQPAATTGSPGHIHDALPVAASTDRGPHCMPQRPPAYAAMADEAGNNQYFGHIPTAIEWSTLSLKNSCDMLNVLMPDWVVLREGTQKIEIDIEDSSVRGAVEDYMARAVQHPQLLPTITLEFASAPVSFVQQILHSDQSGALSQNLSAISTGLEASGLCLDFRQLDAQALKQLTPFLNSFSAKFRADDLRSCLVLSVDQKIWADRALMASFDHVILKAFREPWAGSTPAPLADPAWLEAVTRDALASIDPDRLTIALGNFAAEWQLRDPLPTLLPYGEAVSRIAEAGGQLRFSAETGNSFSSFRDDQNRSHKLWLMDAVSVHNQLQTLKGLGVRNIGIWSLGNEDPGLWNVLAEQYQDPASLMAQLSPMSLPNYISYEGKGAFLEVTSEAEPGLRFVSFDTQTGFVRDVEYQKLPKPYRLKRYGQPAAHKLVLTFDDGPHVDYTRAILDTLKETKTPAAFFVVGARVLEEPDLLKRMIEEGHEVGSHTFSHPRMDQVSQSRAALEHGMMSKLIAGYSGHETKLYREPFLRAGGPIEASRVRSLMDVQARGGIISGMDIVPKDWEGLTTQEIVDYVVGEVKRGAGNVILLHDGGEDRSASVAAVPLLIATLRTEGYEFTTLADLLGTTHSALMPETGGSWLLFDRLSFEFLSVSWSGLEWVFWAVLIIGAVRMLSILALSIIRQRTPPLKAGYHPKVTVVIPAHNEENVIVKCVRSVLANDYANFDVLIVDDGSTDGTFDRLFATFCNTPRVRLLAQFNRGKWAALNTAIAAVKSEVIICIDADTEVRPDAIRHLVQQFNNPRVGAVAGKIAVGNRKGLLTRLQALEYVTSQNFDRRAYDLLNGMLVVPGALGAWRVDAIRKAGLYSRDTMTEDADLTIAVTRAGYRVTYEERAVAYTEAPGSIRQLLTQRLRWSLGMLQCAWKHKGAIKERRVIGLLAIPDLVIFGYLFPLLAPIADIFVVILLYNVLAGVWSGEVGVAVTSMPTHLLWAYLLLPMLDLATTAYALKTDRDESLGMLLLFPFQRFFYRQLLYFSVYRSLLRALTGSLAEWGRMKRFGTNGILVEAT
jgi:peptidoglycan-N-acetylglucosamine deacetylase